MDEGLPISYEVLDRGVPVYAAEGDAVGTVEHVVAAEREDIFHGIVIRAEAGQKFVAAEDVASLHERGVDLRISAEDVAELPEPHGAAPVKHIREPGVKPSRWSELVDMVTGLPKHHREWSDE
jgi:hypothetical protein